MNQPSASTIAIIGIASTLAIAVAGAEAGPSPDRPPSLVQPVAAAGEIATIRMPAVDVAAYRAEDAAFAQSGRPVPFRFAAAIETAITPARDGSWENLPNGWLLWRVRIVSPGALSLNLGMDRFNLPTGATLWLFDGSGTMVQGPYTSSDRNALGGLWTPVIVGDELVVELDLPPGSAADADLRIASVNHGYRGFGDDPTVPGTKQGSCNIDVICPEGDGWRDQIRSVARLIVSGTYFCTGQLLNTTAQDETPYMLTAQHCVENASQAATVVAFWNYESPVCGMLAGGNLTDYQSGATLVSSWQWGTGSDFSLLLLDETPDQSFNVYYSGWDATGDVPLGSVGIHHPSGDEKALALNDDPLIPTNYYGNGSHQWEVSEWEQGTTEGGSSGSCLYDPASRLCVGTLTAGTASCSNPSGYDIYGRMDVHWTGNGAPTNRLSDWLDPLGTGVLTLSGRDSGASIFSDDFETGGLAAWSMVVGGVEPELQVTIADPFPPTAAGTCSPPEPVLVENLGEVALEIQTLALQGRFYFDYYLSSQLEGPMTIPPHGSDNSLSVYFCPDVITGAPYFGQLSIVSNDPDSPEIVPLTGTEYTPPK